MVLAAWGLIVPAAVTLGSAFSAVPMAAGAPVRRGWYSATAPDLRRVYHSLLRGVSLVTPGLWWGFPPFVLLWLRAKAAERLFAVSARSDCTP